MPLKYEVLELVSPMVCLLDGRRVSFINQAGVLMLGLETAELAVGRNFETFVDDDYRILMEMGWEQLTEEEVVPLKLIREGGEVFDAELRVRCLPGNGSIFLIEVRDISKFVKSAIALRDREERLTGVLRSVAEGILTIGMDGRIETANPAAEKMFGYHSGCLAGLEISALMPESQREWHTHLFYGLLGGQPSSLVGRMVEGIGLRTDGSQFAIEISISELRHGRQRLYTAILRDISERKENEERIHRLAHHDQLTGLPNRNLLSDRLKLALARVKRHGGRVAVLYVDLDRFKPINDCFGHEAGDLVLKEVANRLSASVRASDTVARVGGDEFVVVLEEIHATDDVAPIARKIVESLSIPIEIMDNTAKIGASIGVAMFPDDGSTIEEVNKAADAAMYRVKNSGRNGFCFYSDKR